MPEPVKKIDLPADCKMMVLDYITLPPDLKALCLASKAWRPLATARLYSNVTLNIFHKSHIKRFKKCVAVGASRYLPATRALVLIDENHPIEMVRGNMRECTCAKPADCTFEDSKGYRFGHDQKQQWVCNVIEMFPNDTLHTFRYLSYYEMSDLSFDTLLSKQRKLQDLSLTVDWLDFQFEKIRNVFDQLQSIDIQCESLTRLNAARHDFMRLMKLGTNLQRICIGGSGGYQDLVSCRCPISEPKTTQPRLKLKELSLRHVDLDSLFPVLSHIIDFHSLSKLTLWKCLSVAKFLIEMGASYHGTSLQLTHIAVTIEINGWDSDDREFPEWEKVEDALVRVFQASGNIRSLYLSVSAIDPHTPLKTLLEKISPIVGTTLRTLALHGMLCTPLTHTIRRKDFAYICQSFPNLQQLGIQCNPATGAKALINVESLKDVHLLQNLRIIHVAQSKIDPDHTHNFDERQKIANRLFESLEPNSNLKYVVFGSYGLIEEDVEAYIEVMYDDNEPEWSDDGIGVPQAIPHVYMRGEQWFLGQKKFVAIPISRRQSRDYEPDLETILDGDYRNDWMGRLPGRFHD